MRTGLSDAVATDDADDSYDLSWMSGLPADDIRAISALRQLLAHDTDPINRHFMHAQLENLLYGARNAFASAPDEYDQACRDHDGEMDAIRQAFMAKWGQVPVLEAYRQMAIRQQKVGNLEQARGGRSEALLSTGTTPLAQKPPRIYADGQPATPQHAGRRRARQALRASWPVLEVAHALHALCRHGRNAQQRHTRCCLKSSEKPEVVLLHTG